MIPPNLLSVGEAALELDTDEERIRAAAARLGLERHRGQYSITRDELAAIREELGLPSVLDDDGDSDDGDSDNGDSDDGDSDDDDFDSEDWDGEDADDDESDP